MGKSQIDIPVKHVQSMCSFGYNINLSHRTLKVIFTCFAIIGLNMFC